MVSHSDPVDRCHILCHTPAMETAEQFGTALSAARRLAGDPSYNDIVRELWRRLGDLAPTAETIRRYHAGKVSPDKADVLVVMALADIYRCRVSDLSQAVEAHRLLAKDLLAKSKWSSPEMPSEVVLFGPGEGAEVTIHLLAPSAA